jgi:glutamate dehydrogenase
VRVDGRQLRARVIGEGANLACTQRGRIEYAAGGGRINMDAIDNAAGVDCSDHEVNIKIALRPTLEDDRLTMDARNALLTAMTDDVAALVLRDNVLQSRAISLEQQGGREARDWLLATMRSLEREGRLDRAVEYLPGEEALARRAAADSGLTRPEIAILLSYAKLALNDALIQDSVPDEPYFVPDLQAYFPSRLHEGFPDLAGRHPLHREIVATVLANEIVNRCGIAFFTRLREESGADAGDVARAYALTRAAFGMPALWQALDRHDLHLPAERMLSLYAELRDFMHRQTLWALRNLHHPIALDAALGTFVPHIAELSANIEEVMAGSTAAAALSAYRAELSAFGLSPDVARGVASLRPLDSAFDIVQAAQSCHRPITDAARAYFRLGAALGLDGIKARIAQIETQDHWEARALQAEVEDLYAAQRTLTAEALSAVPDREAATAMEQWLTREDAEVARAQRALADLEASGPLTVPKLTLVGRLLRGLSGS